MITIMYFSPVGGTKKIVMTLMKELVQTHEVKEICINSPLARKPVYEFTEKDVLIVASPTYAGRIPNKIMPFFRDNIIGNGALCIPVVTYGNRSYDSSLLEMAHLMERNGFHLLGAGAFVTKHAMSETLAKDRPNEEDLEEIRSFARAIVKKLNHMTEDSFINLEGEVGPYYIPKKENGEKAVFLKAKPIVDHDICIKCGKCADCCPMGSISKEMDYETMSICIKCHACIQVCPADARSFHDSDLASHIRMLEENYCGVKRQNTVLMN